MWSGVAWDWYRDLSSDGRQVAAMIAADWYGVHPDTKISAGALRLGPTLDQLVESDAELLESLAQRLART